LPALCRLVLDARVSVKPVKHPNLRTGEAFQAAPEAVKIISFANIHGSRPTQIISIPLLCAAFTISRR
jgi:hypothetical protein